MQTETKSLKINLEATDKKNRRYTSVKEFYLLLRKDFVEYKSVLTYESNDNDLEVWNEYKGNYR